MNNTGRNCTKCGEWKPFTEFHRSGDNKSGFAAKCKKCESERGKAKYLGSRESILKAQFERRSSNPEKHREQGKRWYLANKDRHLANASQWRKNNPEKSRAYTTKWECANPEKRRERDRRRRQTSRGKIENAIRAGINKGIKSQDKRGNRTFDILGYSVAELMDHLERQFTDGMSWKNYGHSHSCWHIEHKIPIAAHNYDTPYDIDFERCWSLKNLRPMWAEENWLKSDKLDSEFQPSLAIALPIAANDSAKKVMSA